MLGLEHELSDIDNAGNGTRLLCSFGRNDDRVWRGGSTTRYAGSGTLPPAAERVNAWLTAAVETQIQVAENPAAFCVQNMRAERRAYDGVRRGRVPRGRRC